MQMGQWMRGMCIKEIMTKKVISVTPETPLVEAAKLLNDHGFNGVPVIDGKRQLVGILTQYDLIEKELAH